MTDDNLFGDQGATAGEYQVLARKYRPATFADVIGQEHMVRTLRNAFETGRLAHAFILTGVRGVGKTTTARLIAKALNCTGRGESDTPAFDPCGECDNCRAIAESRHVDVLEMDAASRTGIDDVREIIESVQYMPVSAPYKVYIIDEVHMLSRQAFNGLLKTLEEPPEHVKFIFATTEIRRVPVTVLSRCQRFDLRRIETNVLSTHLAELAKKEEIEIDSGAIALLTRAAEGSVRDGQSLLDQAIAHGTGTVTEEQVRDMLGLADRARILDLMEHVLTGDIAAALKELRQQYDQGADAATILRDLLDLTHELTRGRILDDAPDAFGFSDTEHARAMKIADALPMPVLGRVWQMLMKGLEEVQRAPRPIAAAEMALIRIAHGASLPTPEEILEQINASGSDPAALARTGRTGETAPEKPTSAPPAREAASGGTEAVAARAEVDPAPPPPDEMEAPDPAGSAPALQSFTDVVDLLAASREGRLRAELENHAHPVSFEQGRLEIRLAPGAAKTLLNRLSQFLTESTGSRWIVGLSNEEGGPTIAGQRNAERDAQRAVAAEDPDVRLVLDTFPGSEIVDVREIDATGEDGDT